MGLHPMFGTMTIKEWGKLLQIHIDYHLTQRNEQLFRLHRGQ
jgi:hypothetical protein